MTGEFCAIRPVNKTAAATARPNVDEIYRSAVFRLIVFVLMACAILLTGLASAHADSRTVRPGDARSGTLLFKAVEENRYVEAPLVGADVDITVSGPTARARITQHFYNPTDGWVEGVYVYPLPENSAVDTLKMVIGGRVIVGEIKERREAKRIYEQAKADGKKTALVEQERPNIFTNSVANIGPGETIVVQLEYQQTIPQSGNEFSLRVPLVVAPRYNPKPLVQTVDFGRDGDGWGRVSDPVPDRDRITPPVLDPRENPPVNPVTLKVRLEAGFPLGEVTSHHHAIKMDAVSDDTRIVTIDGAVPADRDFELTWSPNSGTMPAAGLFHEQLSGADYLLAFLTPPSLEQPQTTKPREIIFVIDNSGSMGGQSIVQAKASLKYALKQLSPADRFNVVRFDNTLELLFPSAVPADMEHIGQAQTFVARLQAEGGTEMVPAMQAALVDQNAADRDTLRQVVFLTDGAIGNENQLFDTIAAGLGRSRIFMVGIGSAPNSYLMNRAAELGRGSVLHIGSAEQVEDRMRALFNKLAKPAVTDLSVKFSESGVDVTPKVLPDLYAGETLQIAAKLSTFGGTAEISGSIGDQPWIVTLPLKGAAEAKGISKLWARAKIADAEVALALGKISKTSADQRILSLALEHSLVSRLTSLVAVDKTPSRPEGAQLSRADLPLNLPAGWDFDKVFGTEGRSTEQREQGGETVPAPDAQDDGLKIDAAYIQKIAAAHKPASASLSAKQTVASVPLPKTATNGTLYLCLGFGLLFMMANVRLLVLTRRMPRRGFEKAR
jgi:Ca-activated chloride channel family protein